MRRASALLIYVSCLAAFSFAQTADELIAKNIEARGGMEKMKAIRTLRMTGKFDGDGITATVGQENERPNLVRETFSLQGMIAIQAYDGSTGWQIQPFGGKKTPELMGEDDLRDLLLDADFDGPLVDYKEKGNTVEYLGHDVVDGDDALRLKITLKNGGSQRDRVMGLGSYKPVNGVMYPFSISQGPKNHPDAQTVTVRKMEANVTIDPADFNLPPSLRTEEKKSGIVGVH
jgi:hypothetical protein